MKNIKIRLIASALVLTLTALALVGCIFPVDIEDLLDKTADGILENDAFSYADAINDITTSKMCSTVTLTTLYYNQNFFGITTESATSIGSGTVIMSTSESGGTNVYVLTNAHCVNDISKYEHKTITVTDYRGNAFSACSILQGSVSERYDLAIVVFTASNAGFGSIKLADENPKINDIVFSLGSPHAQTNSITTGRALRYYTGELIEVEALYHSALVGSGGSGGALLNGELELCGVNFAADDTEDDFSNGSAIPVESVREYLTTLKIFTEILD